MQIYQTVTGFFYVTVNDVPTKKFIRNPGDNETIQDGETAHDVASAEALEAIEVETPPTLAPIVSSVRLLDTVTGAVQIVTLENGELHYNPET